MVYAVASRQLMAVRPQNVPSLTLSPGYHVESAVDHVNSSGVPRGSLRDSIPRGCSVLDFSYWPPWRTGILTLNKPHNSIRYSELRKGIPSTLLLRYSHASRVHSVQYNYTDHLTLKVDQGSNLTYKGTQNESHCCLRLCLVLKLLFCVNAVC